MKIKSILGRIDRKKDKRNPPPNDRRGTTFKIYDFVKVPLVLIEVPVFHVPFEVHGSKVISLLMFV